MFSPITISPKSDPGTTTNALNDNFKQLESEARRKVYTDSDGEDRIIIGQQEDGSYEIIVKNGNETTFSTQRASAYEITDPLYPTLNYVGGTGSKVWSSSDSVIPPTIDILEYPKTPDVHAYITNIDNTWGNIRFKLPYIEFDASGNVILKIDIRLVNLPQSWYPQIMIQIPPSSTYYAGNHSFKFIARIFNA